jgi:hypothetical protein
MSRKKKTGDLKLFHDCSTRMKNKKTWANLACNSRGLRSAFSLHLHKAKFCPAYNQRALTVRERKIFKACSKNSTKASKSRQDGMKMNIIKTRFGTGGTGQKMPASVRNKKRRIFQKNDTCHNRRIRTISDGLTNLTHTSHTFGTNRTFGRLSSLRLRCFEEHDN